MSRIIVAILLAAIAVGGVALYRNWVVVDATPPSEAGDSTTHIKIKVDAEKAREDVRNLIVRPAVQGEITAVDAKMRQLTLQAENATHEVRVTPETTVRRGDQKTTFESLRVGDKAKVQFQDADGQEAVSVEIIIP